MSATTRSRRWGVPEGLAAGGAGPLWLAFAILAGLPLFSLGLAGLAEAWARPEFSHGPVIPVLSFYLFLREMRRVPPVAGPVDDRWPGVAVTGLALAINRKSVV